MNCHQYPTKIPGPERRQELPLELWSRILHEDQGFDRADFKRLCLVCWFFKRICQPFVFKDLASTLGSGKIGNRSSGRWDMAMWKTVLERIARFEQRLILIGGSPHLACLPRTWKMQGIQARRNVPPKLVGSLEKAFQAVTTAVTAQLERFTRLRRLELDSFRVEEGLLDAVALHPSLKELVFKLSCSYSDKRSPIPSLHFLRFEGMPCDDLMQVDQIQRLALGAASSTLLNNINSKLQDNITPFRQLRELSMDLPLAPPGADDVARFLSFMPVLQVLKLAEKDRRGMVPHAVHFSDTVSPFPLSSAPRLQEVSACPRWAKHLVPGRPVHTIHLGVPERQTNSFIFLKTAQELDAFLRPLTLSAVNVTTLHFQSTAMAPVGVLAAFVAEAFPLLRDLALPVLPSGRTAYYGSLSKCSLCDAPLTEGNALCDVQEFTDAVAEEIRRGVVENMTGEGSVTGEAGVKRDTAMSAATIVDRYLTEERPPRQPVTTGEQVEGSEMAMDEGEIDRVSKNYENILLAFADGRLPLPSELETLTLLPNVHLHELFPSRSGQELREHLIGVSERISIRCPNLAYINFVGTQTKRYYRRFGKGNPWEMVTPI